MEVERISSLPDNIIDKILSRLSVRDAVRTSILSRNWRNRWMTLPNLVFDDNLFLYGTPIRNIVDHVLLLHIGPIRKFKLSHPDLEGFLDIDRWILYLSRTSIKIFVLDIFEGDKYPVPLSIYSCQNLIHLELFNCVLKAPLDFNGFKRLKSLNLQKISMDQSTFEQVIYGCPLLEELTLKYIEGFTHLNIHAPNLVYFDVDAVFDEIDLKETFHLVGVTISLDAYPTSTERSLHGNLSKFLACLPHIERLKVKKLFLKYLAGGIIPGKIPTACLDLTFISITINFNDGEENLAALCLLRSSPNLQELKLRARRDDAAGATTSNVENFKIFPCNQLRLIKIVNIFGFIQELSFVKFLLVNTPVLETMTVKPHSDVDEADLMKQLLRFRRASMAAEIIYI